MAVAVAPAMALDVLGIPGRLLGWSLNTDMSLPTTRHHRLTAQLDHLH